MNQAKSRQPARGQRMSPGYSIPLEMCNTLYLQGGVYESKKKNQSQNQQTKIQLCINRIAGVNLFQQCNVPSIPPQENVCANVSLQLFIISYHIIYIF